jgi:hypothetical protein
MTLLMIAIATILAFLLGAFLGMIGLLYPLARNPHLHMYWDGKRFVRDSRLIPLTGLRDMNGNEIKPGNLVLMLSNGYLLLISKDVHTTKETIADPAALGENESLNNPPL